MARVRGVATTQGEIAASIGAAKTILQIVAAANHPVAIKGVSVSFDGTSASAEPIQVDLLRQTTAGTMSAGTPVEETTTGTTLQTTSQINATVEPTAGNVLRRWEVHPQSGLIEKFTIEDEIVVAGGGRLGLRITAPAAVNALGSISFEE
jgi:hypothetical protein